MEGRLGRDDRLYDVLGGYLTLVARIARQL